MKQILFIIVALVLVGCAATESNVLKIYKVPEISIHRAAIEGNIEAVKRHLAAGTDLNVKNSRGLTPLHAVRFDQKEITELLIEKGADINARNAYGETILHSAVYNGRIGFVELLINNDVEINSKDSRGLTPLHRAAVLGLKEIAALLIAEGADVNAKDKKGETPLDWADEEIVDFLRRHGGKTSEELNLLVIKPVFSNTLSLDSFLINDCYNDLSSLIRSKKPSSKRYLIIRSSKSSESRSVAISNS